MNHESNEQHHKGAHLWNYPFNAFWGGGGGKNTYSLISESMEVKF